MSENGHASSSATALHRPELVRTNSEKTDYDQTQHMIEEVKQHTHEAMVPPPPQLAATAHIRSMEQYTQMYSRSINDSNAFWKEVHSAPEHSNAAADSAPHAPLTRQSSLIAPIICCRSGVRWLRSICLGSLPSRPCRPAA
jgi:hypothetical protein